MSRAPDGSRRWPVLPHTVLVGQEPQSAFPEVQHARSECWLSAARPGVGGAEWKGPLTSGAALLSTDGSRGGCCVQGRLAPATVHYAHLHRFRSVSQMHSGILSCRSHGTELWAGDRNLSSVWGLMVVDVGGPGLILLRF